MALRIWLPLNGNLNNKGLGPQPVNDGTLTYDNGKIGQCRKTGGAKFTANQSTQIFNDNGFTYCAWIYVPGEAGGAIGSPNCFFGRDGAPRIYAIFQYPKVDDLHLSWTQYNDDKSSSIYKAGIQCNDFFDVKTWVHVAVTYEPGKITVYKNGVQYATTTGTPTWSTQPGGYEYETWALTNTPNAYFNDIRVYDECLSPKQIKEISKGLVAHYKLDTSRALNNLKRNATYGTYNNFASSGSTCTVVDTGTTYKGSKVYRMTYTPNDTSLSSVRTSLHSHGVTTPGQTFKANTKYCYWTLCKPISHPDSVIGGTASNIGNWTEIPMKEYGNGWYIVGQSRNGTVTSDKTDTIFTSFKTPSATSGTPIIIDFCCPHLVEGYDYIIPEFDYAGTAVTQEKDVSGNGYNGTISGTLTYNNNTPRYEGCTTFTSGLVNSPACAVLANSKDFSINGWFYRTGGATITYYASAENYNTSVDLEGSRYFVYGSNGTAYVGNWTSAANTWQMITLVHNSVAKTLSLYVNGNYISQVATSGDIYANNTLNIGGRQNSANFAGSISDFRIYATALTADDILTLYKTSGIIDNKGNIYAYEFKTNAYNMVGNANDAIAMKQWKYSISSTYSQTNCTPSLTDDGYRIYRPANLAANKSQWGGVKLCPNYAGDILIKGHKYILLYDVKGQTSNVQATTGWSNNMGWGGGGLNPQPSNVSYKLIPANFNSTEWETFWYKWDLNDDVRKTCTSSYSSFVEGNVYLSYRDFQIGWVYTATGELGTDLYFRNFRLYDITNPNKPQIVKQGLMISDDINEIGDKAKIRQIDYEADNFIEI